MPSALDMEELKPAAPAAKGNVYAIWMVAAPALLDAKRSRGGMFKGKKLPLDAPVTPGGVTKNPRGGYLASVANTSTCE